MNADELSSKTEKFVLRNVNTDTDEIAKKNVGAQEKEEKIVLQNVNTDTDEIAKNGGAQEEETKFVLQNVNTDTDEIAKKNGGAQEKEEKDREGNCENASESWLVKLKDELRPNKKLIPLKVLTFLFFGGMFSMIPFYVLHMRQLGLSVTEVAVVYSVIPFPAIVGPVISGLVADFTGRYKAVLVANTIMTMVCYLSTVFTPPLGVGHHQPAVMVVFNISGYALGDPFCVPEGDASHTETMEQLSCSSDCFKDNDLAPFLNETANIRCGAVNDSRGNLLGDCIVRMDSASDCGYHLDFFPLVRDMTSLKLQRTSFRNHDPNCSVSCSKIATDSTENTGFSNSRTFWIYLFLRLLGALSIESSFTMMDACILAVLLKEGGNFGKQRLVGLISMATFPFFASCLVIQTEAGVDYSPVFYLSACLLSACVVVAYFIDIRKDDAKDGKNDLRKNMKELFKKMEVNVFLFVIFLLGANWGFIESFLFVYLKTLNAPTYLLGLTLTFGCMMGAPVLFVSDRIVEKLGRQVIFVIAFVAYTVRMFGYSFIANPWCCFLFEALEVFTNQIMWVAAVTYFPILAPACLLGTLSGIAGAVHYNIGRGGGAFIGGFLISHIGMVWTFRAFGIASFFFAIIYIAIQKIYLNKAFVKKAQDDDSANTTKMAA